MAKKPGLVTDPNQLGWPFFVAACSVLLGGPEGSDLATVEDWSDAGDAGSTS
jgi:hypothetical protein